VPRIVIPRWPAGTVALLATTGADGAPGSIPISTALRASDTRVLLALGRRRATLQALRDEPRCALALLAAGNVAVTLHGRASVVADAPAGAEGITAVAIDVDRVQDHATPRFVIADGVQWSWVDEEARPRDVAVRAVLQRLAGLR
jgi:flavin reductase (DIM6/NTAB) family NADH-FMN oxidoreductase RutF